MLLEAGASVDPQYNEPFIEIEEERSEPAPHRYVHGRFKGTDACFSFYFPPKDRYQDMRCLMSPM